MTASRKVTVPLAVLALIAVGATLHTLGAALLPFVVAFFLANLFRPMVQFLVRKRVPMILAILLVVLLVGAVLFGVAIVAISSVQSLVAALPKYEAKWNGTLLPSILQLIQRAPQELQAQVKNLKLTNIVDASAILGILSTGAGSFVSLVSGLILILLFMLFILGGNGTFTKKVRKAYPDQADALADMIEKIDQKVQKYMITVSLVNLASGALTTGILAAFGVDLALLWGLLTFLVNYIPTIGSIIAFILPVAVAFLQFDNVGTPIAVGVTLIVLQFTLGSVLTPKIMGSSLNLSPLLVLISLFFWGWIWGPWGMILSVPITSTIKIVLESISGMEPIAILMSAEGKSSGKRSKVSP
jgi:AI-2 transport protein TqsA